MQRVPSGIGVFQMLQHLSRIFVRPSQRAHEHPILPWELAEENDADTYELKGVRQVMAWRSHYQAILVDLDNRLRTPVLHAMHWTGSVGCVLAAEGAVALWRSEPSEALTGAAVLMGLAIALGAAAGRHRAAVYAASEQHYRYLDHLRGRLLASPKLTEREAELLQDVVATMNEAAPFLKRSRV